MVVPDELTGGPRFAAFCSRYIIQTKGRWGGRPLDLEGWQREFWWEALEVDPTTGLRIYSEIGLGIPRKNGKSTQASAGGLYMLAADGENEPEVYAAAAAKNQAGIVLGQARSMALRSPRLLDLVLARKYQIECPGNGGIMRAVSSLANLQFGFNPHANIVDELMAHQDGELYGALTTGTSAREQPFTLWISTAGPNDSGILADFYRSMFDGPGELEQRSDSLLIYRDRVNGVLIWWFGAPRDADIEDPRVWLACNPASWLRDRQALSREYGRLKSRGALLEWKMYHLNQFAGVEESWLPDGAWAKCADERLPNDEPAHALRVDLPIGVGVHKAHTSDGAAVAIAQRQEDKFVIRCRLFAPEAATGRVSTDAMRMYLRELRGAFPKPAMADDKTRWPIHGPAFAFDKWAFSESAETLDQEGLNMIDFPQGAAHMGPATTTAFELITTGRLIHDGDAQLAGQVEASVAVLTERGMRVTSPRKTNARANYACIAVLMAVAMASQAAQPVYASSRRAAAGF